MRIRIGRIREKSDKSGSPQQGQRERVTGAIQHHLASLPATVGKSQRRVSEEPVQSATEQATSKEAKHRSRSINQHRFRFARWFCFRLLRFSALNNRRSYLVVSGSEWITTLQTLRISTNIHVHLL